MSTFSPAQETVVEKVPSQKLREDIHSADVVPRVPHNHALDPCWISWHRIAWHHTALWHITSRHTALWHITSHCPVAHHIVSRSKGRKQAGSSSLRTSNLTSIDLIARAPHKDGAVRRFAVVALKQPRQQERHKRGAWSSQPCQFGCERRTRSKPSAGIKLKGVV